jgi:prephenate dehydratase
LKVGYFGEPGAYSNMAAMRMASGDYMPLESVRAVFTALQDHKIDAGVVPVENSIEGAVNQTYDFLFKTDFYIVKEYYLRVRHCLIGKPDSQLGDIKYVISHPQALAQCSEFIYKHGFRTVSEYDTAGSVKIVRDGSDSSRAAIASELAAGIYGMKILSRDIENNSSNYTRFFLIARNPVLPEGRAKISIVFSTENKAGSLYSILKVFNEFGINMTKIESRPVQYNPFNYIFFIDIERNENSDEAMAIIRGMTSPFRILGVYEIASINE